MWSVSIDDMTCQLRCISCKRNVTSVCQCATGVSSVMRDFTRIRGGIYDQTAEYRIYFRHARVCMLCILYSHLFPEKPVLAGEDLLASYAPVGEKED